MRGNIRPSFRHVPNVAATALLGLLLAASLRGLLQQGTEGGTPPSVTPPPAPSGPDAPSTASARDEPSSSEPPSPPPAPKDEAAEEAAREAELKAYRQREAQGARATKLLRVARRDPARAIQKLSTMELPWARAWAGFLEIATAEPYPDAEARRLRGAERIDQAAADENVDDGGTLSPGVPAGAHASDASHGPGQTSPPAPPEPWTVSVEDAMFMVRFIGEETSGSEDVPCWIARRWPVAWAEAYNAYHGSSRDGRLPTCGPPLDQRWLWERTLQGPAFLGEMNSFCGTIRHAYLRSMQLSPFEAWYTPRDVLRRRSDLREFQAAAHKDLLERLEGDVRTRDRWLRAMQPPAVWRSKLEARGRAKGLTKAEARDVVDLTVGAIEVDAIEAELACGYEKDDGAAPRRETP